MTTLKTSQSTEYRRRGRLRSTVSIRWYRLSNQPTRSISLTSRLISDGGDLREYTGVKPDEFLTIDRSGQTITDYSSSSMGRNTTTSTAARYNTNTPLIKPGNGHHDGPVNYDTGKTPSRMSHKLPNKLVTHHQFMIFIFLLFFQRRILSWKEGWRVL